MKDASNIISSESIRHNIQDAEKFLKQELKPPNDKKFLDISLLYKIIK
jgi:hypothetical protein